ncbi:hypothetical protein GUJ93_ZPchr0003g18299 [Zizania palustris]|uniref:Uncharacterized protein n=1 Tax=Zizania palustris TaxID=103762 RepID=A0A8J5VIK8_ZIZPA|nr:hypothetical protein GUJ93_ZPchr0003g18299 [Zizania palustris]
MNAKTLQRMKRQMEEPSMISPRWLEAAAEGGWVTASRPLAQSLRSRAKPPAHALFYPAIRPVSAMSWRSTMSCALVHNRPSPALGSPALSATPRTLDPPKDDDVGPWFDAIGLWGVCAAVRRREPNGGMGLRRGGRRRRYGAERSTVVARRWEVDGGMGLRGGRRRMAMQG